MKKLLAFTISLLTFTCSYAVLSSPGRNAPNDNDTGRSTSPYFYLSGITSSADEIVVEYSENIGMTNATLIIRARYNTGAFLYASKLKLNTDYYWRVKVRSSTDSSVWSSIWKFTTRQIFSTIQPSGNVDELRASFVNFRCDKVYGYDTILWEIDTTSSFNSTLLRSIARPDTGSYHEVVTLQENFYYNQKYYWRARGFSGASTTAWTPILYFVTGDTIGLKYPSPAFNQDVEIEFEWSAWRDDEPFQVQLDTSPSFSSPLIDTFSATGARTYPNPRFAITHLNYETKYYYRVRSYNTMDTTTWSYSSFTTNGLANDVVIAENYADPIVAIRNRTAIDGSDGYQILLDTSSNFDSPLLTSTYSPDGRDTARDLLFGIRYYAKARPYHSKDTGEWTRTRPINIIMYPITYYPYRNYTDIGVKDSLQFGSRAGIDGYQIQVTAGSNYDTTLLLDTTRTGLPVETSSNYIKGLTFKYNTTYEWRIRGWHSKDTSVWSDSKKFTTVVSPTLTRPFNSDFLGDQAELDLQWESVDDNARYQVMLDTTTAFNSQLLVDAIVDTNALSQKDLLFRPLYYWKVRIVTSNDTSAWSDTWKFTVLHSRLNWPKNNRTDINLSSLDWYSIAGTKGYILQVDSFVDFRAPLEALDTVQNSFFHYFLEKPDYVTFNTKYYWRVKLYHSKDTTEWSDIWNFTTLPRRSPILSSPVDSSEDISVFVTLQWQTYSLANSYAIEYSTNSDFSNATKKVSTGTSIQVSMSPNTRYYWRARGRNSDGNEFYDWSKEWTFTTDQGIPAPVLISPADRATEVASNVVLRWNKDDNAVSYRVELSSDSNFLGKYAKTVSTTSTTFDEIYPGSKYYWRVRTNATGISSSWSEGWSFSTSEVNAVVDIAQIWLRLYPNPAEDIVVMESDKQFRFVHIINDQGRLVLKGTEGMKQSTSIDVSSLSPGIYSIKTLVEGHAYNIRFVKL
ncbi:MAG: hypothetical protein COA58_10280 [Bacteroidetes bacterium]|nr:MAG: hypothetical protein COA58_10280 [Bacteroidota bacterium]